jgi:hypothetical protein
MSTATYVDAAMQSLTAAIQAHIKAGGDAHQLTGWLIGRLKLSDQRVASALIHNASRFVAAPPDRRPFTELSS